MRCSITKENKIEKKIMPISKSFPLSFDFVDSLKYLTIIFLLLTNIEKSWF
jgi:hypothetical protein